MSTKQKPFDKVLIAGGKLNMAAQYPERFVEVAEGNTPEFLNEVNEAFGILMEFRNIVNSMASLNEMPRDAAKMYEEGSSE